MSIEKYLPEKDELNQLLERNKDLIEALKNLRQKLGGQVDEESADVKSDGGEGVLGNTIKKQESE